MSELTREGLGDPSLTHLFLPHILSLMDSHGRRDASVVVAVVFDAATGAPEFVCWSS